MVVAGVLWAIHKEHILRRMHACIGYYYDNCFWLFFPAAMVSVNSVSRLVVVLSGYVCQPHLL